MSSLNGARELSLPDLLPEKGEGGSMTSRNDFGRRHFQTCADVLRSVEKSTERASSLENSVSPKGRAGRFAQGETRNQGEDGGALTVKEVIEFMSRTKNRWGISGYDIPKFDAKLDKSFHAKISGSKKTSYLDDEMKRTKRIPAPWQYNTMGHGLLDPKKKGTITKSKKLTFLAQIARDSARNHIPGPGAYKP